MTNFTLVQFDTNIVSPIGNDVVSEYYEAIYKQEYFNKPSQFWELPLWAGELSYSLDKYNHDFKVLNQPCELSSSYIFGSVMDTNKHLFLELVKLNPNSTFVLGGYIESGFFFDYDNVVWSGSIKESMNYLNIPYQKGVSWKLFKGIDCIPRLTLSNGCVHKCKFCTVPNAVVQVYKSEVDKQIEALKPLKFNLIYLNDKTFGQSSNYRLLKELYPEIKKFNPDFKGFIVQTTASAAVRINWTDLHIYAAEIGVESYNDAILKGLNKPANCDMIDKAEQVLKANGIKYIVNIVVGFVGETIKTYKRTIDYIKRADLLHVNLYNLAVYDNTKLGDEIDHNNEADTNELISEKSYNTSKQNRLNNTVMKYIAKHLLTRLKTS